VPKVFNFFLEHSVVAVVAYTQLQL